MSNNNLGDQFNLIDKSKIKLIIAHGENREILKNYLSKDYEIVISSTTNINEKSDMLILDEKGFEENKEIIFDIKKSNTSHYLPLILITRTSPENIPDTKVSRPDAISDCSLTDLLIASPRSVILSSSGSFLPVHPL